MPPRPLKTKRAERRLQAAVIRDHPVRLEQGHAVARRAECHEDAANPGIARGVPVSRGVPHKAGTGHISARPLDRGQNRGGVRLAHREGIRPDERREQIAHPEPPQQLVRHGFGLVGADADRPAIGAQAFDSLDRAGIQNRVAVDIAGIGGQQRGILPIEFIRAMAARAPESQRQHCPPPLEGGPGIGDGIEHFTQPKIAETTIGSGDQVPARIGKGPVKIEDGCPHGAP